MSGTAASDRGDGPSVTRLLAERAAGLRFDSLAENVRELARQCLIDWLGVAIAGSREPLARILMEEAREEGGAPRASVVGHALVTSASQATLLNGSFSHALDYDDVNLAMTGHPTVPVMPAVLALAEAEGVDGAAAMTAFVGGYETVCRVGQLVAPGHYGRGFHSTSTAGAFGAAAACGRLLRLDGERMATAMGIAAAQAAGLKSLFGTMCKPLHAGKAAQNGLFAARLARSGFTARPDILECAQGFAATHGPDLKPEAALADPAGGFHLAKNLFKYHAACYLTHAPIEAARHLRDKHVIDPAEIRAIRLRIDSGADKVCNIRAPRTGLEAKFSLRLTVAFALAGIDTAGLASYDEANAARPDLVRLRDLVDITFVPGWPHTLAELELDLADGRTLAARHDSGVPASDLAAQRRRLEEKFRRLAEPVLGAAAAGRLLEAAGEFEKLPRISTLMQLARTPAE